MAAPNWLGFGASQSWVAPDHVAERQGWEHPLRVAPSHPSPARGNSKRLSAFAGGVEGSSKSQALGCRFSADSTFPFPEGQAASPPGAGFRPLI